MLRALGRIFTYSVLGSPRIQAAYTDQSRVAVTGNYLATFAGISGCLRVLQSALNPLKHQ